MSSWSVSPFLRSRIIFTIIPLNYFSGRLPVSNSLSCSSGVLSCAFLWDIFLTVPSSLTFCECGFCSIGCRTAVLVSAVCPLGEAGLEVCAGFLVRGPGSCMPMGGAGSCPSGGQGYVKGLC